MKGIMENKWGWVAFAALMLAALACTCGPLADLTGQEQGDSEQILYSGPDTNGEQVVGSNVQWAVFAEASTQYGELNWSASQATGEPDTFECGDIETAWATESSTGEDWIALLYDPPAIPTRIEIYETYNPGAIIQVDVLDSQSSYFETVYFDLSPPLPDECPRVLTINVNNVTQPIDSIMIYLDQSDHTGWNEIDAVAMYSQ